MTLQDLFRIIMKVEKDSKKKDKKPTKAKKPKYDPRGKFVWEEGDIVITKK